MTTSSEPLSLDCVIIGAGFSGCYALHQLRQRGYSAKIIDAAADFGGVWHYNRYPGALCDTNLPLYQLSDPRVRESFRFTHRFATHTVMRAYFSHMADVLDLRRDTIFRHRVTDAAYDARAGLWRLTAADHSGSGSGSGSNNTLRVVARYAIFATGTTNEHFVPPFPGRDRFRGRVVHPRSWPDDLDVRQYPRVALIGQGSTGVQIAQELAAIPECRLTVFVRTAPLTFPLRQEALPPPPPEDKKQEREAERKAFEELYAAARTYGIAVETKEEEEEEGAAPPVGAGKPFREMTLAERRAVMEHLWNLGGLGATLSKVVELRTDKEANAAFYAMMREKALPRLRDPAKQAVLLPERQPVWFTAKRPVFESNYYEMMDRDNVTVVDLHQDRIRTFADNGIVTARDAAAASDSGPEAETLREFDLVILATGYDSITGSLLAGGMHVRDKDGVPLQERWRAGGGGGGGVRTHLGMMVPGMPNAFLLYGPQSPGPLTCGPPFIEAQVDFVCALLDKSRAERGVGTAVEVTEAAAARYARKLHEAYEKSLASEADSWWVGANVPGKRREPLVWFGGVPAWREACEETLRGWGDFVGGEVRGRNGINGVNGINGINGV